MYAAEPAVPEPNSFKVEIPIEKLWRYKSPGIGQITEELIQATDNTLHYEVHKLIKPTWNKEELPQQWKELIIILIYKKGDKTDSSNNREASLLPVS
jgi:hypothetical protein